MLHVVLSSARSGVQIVSQDDCGVVDGVPTKMAIFWSLSSCDFSQMTEVTSRLVILASQSFFSFQFPVDFMSCYRT